MTMRTGNGIYLGLLFHNHQPVGNFPWVFEQVYQESYAPMVAALERHPHIRISLHYTGSLLDWLEQAHPEFLQRVATLVQKHQVDIVSGGYYEPILPSIPDQDKVVQIRRLNEHIETYFGTTPTGMWIAERVWEPGLPRFLREANIEWTILDDIHFKNVGFDDDELYGYYATEDQSSVLKVYATSQKLRYTIPWRQPEESIAALRTLATPAGTQIAVMGDDGEKFGSWPGTYNYCWGTDGQSGWVDTFFTLLEQNSDWLHTILLGEYAHDYPALGRVYLPTSSYIEMTEWALPPQKSYQFGQLLHHFEQEKRGDVMQFLRGGFWRNFLVRYSEINNQHKKMLRVHDFVYKAGATDSVGLRHLLKAQANDTYWHGLFGGIYMTHVRSAIYHHLIAAQNLADIALHGNQHWQHYEVADFARDTLAKLLIEGDLQNLYFDPQHGGSLFEWDLRRSGHNMTSVMTRRQENYHQTLRQYEEERRRKASAPDQSTQTAQAAENPHTIVRTKEPDLDHYLVVDRYQRNSLIDHFLPPGLPLENFMQERYEEWGDFVEQPYEVAIIQENDGMRINLQRQGQVRRPGALSPLPVQVTKTIFVPVDAEKVMIHYHIENLGQDLLHAWFASEWNLNLLGGGGNPQAYYTFPEQSQENNSFDSSGEVLDIHTLHSGNSWLHQDIAFSLSRSARVWRFSIETVTGSEAGFERTHQGSSLSFLWSLQLEAGEMWDVDITVVGSEPQR